MLVEAVLPSYGSLGPLFYAFGLITREELEQGIGNYDQGTGSTSPRCFWIVYEQTALYL